MLSVMSLSSSTTSILFFLELLLVDLNVSWFSRIGGVVAIIISTSYRSVRYTVVCNWLLLFVSSTKSFLLSKDFSSISWVVSTIGEILHDLSRVPYQFIESFISSQYIHYDEQVQHQRRSR